MSDHAPRRCLSVVMPCYNEATTLEEITTRVLASPYVAELVIVDDGSTDDTRRSPECIDDDRVRVFAQPMNLGKGAALRRGFAESTCPYVIVQDADLEYEPAEYGRLLGPVARRHRRRRVRHAVRDVGRAPRPLLLALGGQRVPHDALQHVHRPQPHRHGDLLQGVPPRGARELRAPGGPIRLRTRDHRQGRRASGGASTRSASPTRGGPTTRARRSAGATACARCYCIVRYSPLLERWNGHPVVRDRAPVDFSDSDAELADRARLASRRRQLRRLDLRDVRAPSRRLGARGRRRPRRLHRAAPRRPGR